MVRELYGLFRRNLPFVVRSEETARNILGHTENKIIEKRNEQNRLIGASVHRGNTIYLLCVDEEYRNRGIGSWLLEQSEEAIKNAGYDEVIIGVGDDYLTPGVPTSKRYVSAENEHGIMECTNAACEEFTQYYRDEFIYTENDSSRVLIATKGTQVVGTLIVDMDAQSGLGSVGCTTVHPDYQGNHIAVNMVILGTKHLKDAGMREAYLSYTYSGLDHMYGYAGYKIFVYFMMARKKLSV